MRRLLTSILGTWFLLIVCVGISHATFTTIGTADYDSDGDGTADIDGVATKCAVGYDGDGDGASDYISTTVGDGNLDVDEDLNDNDIFDPAEVDLNNDGIVSQMEAIEIATEYNLVASLYPDLSDREGGTTLNALA